jgi:hypothetical protein
MPTGQYERKPRPRPNIIGEVYGYLTVVAEAGRTKHNKRIVECNCKCGAVGVTRELEKLRIAKKGGRISSCSCYLREIETTHGDSKSITYQSWHSMIRRCNDPSCKAYPKYGGSGITVCDRWLDYENFKADMGERPSRDYQIDRYPNREGNYEPGNCKWRTRKQNCNNTRTNVRLDFRGKTYTMSELSELTGTPYPRLAWRLKNGLDVESAVSASLRLKPRYEYKGEHLTILEISKRTGISCSLITKRLKNGMDLDWAAHTPSGGVLKRHKKGKHLFGGEYLTLKEIARRTNSSYSLLMDRITSGGWTLEEALAIPKGQRNPRLTRTHT